MNQHLLYQEEKWRNANETPRKEGLFVLQQNYTVVIYPESLSTIREYKEQQSISFTAPNYATVHEKSLSDTHEHTNAEAMSFSSAALFHVPGNIMKFNYFKLFFCSVQTILVSLTSKILDYWHQV